jgi:hypothetical protein
MRRLQHQVTVLDPYLLLPSNRLLHAWVFQTGALFLDKSVLLGIIKAIGNTQFDVIWVDNGAGVLLSPTSVAELKRHVPVIINYTNDNPFVRRDRNRWRLYLQSLQEYTLLAVNRQQNADEARRLGAAKVFLHFMPADEVAHAARPVSDADRSRWGSEVCFVGTWMPERGPFLAALIQSGIPLAIWGNRWQKAREWPLLKRHWRGPAVDSDADYASAILCSKVCLGLLSKGNCDEHTTRSTEIPCLGSLLCAERTPEHLSLYREDEEAVFWDSAEECAEKCFALLRDDELRSRIARNGHQRCMLNGTLNQPTIERIISAALE